MGKGTYLHSERGKVTRDGTGVAYDGLVHGSSTAIFAREHRELGARVRRMLLEENEGTVLDRFLVVRDRVKEATT
jgi:hypothetical protein